MKQFNLSEWLANKSRKVVTRDGRPVRIVCWDAPTKNPIYGFVEGDYGITSWRKDGRFSNLIDNLDIFFADEEEELTEFDYAVLSIISDHNSHTDSIEAFAKRSSKKLLDLARKEIYLTCKEYSRGYQEGLKLGREDVLKDLPKWKKGNDGEFLYETSIVWTHNETKTLATAGLRLDTETIYIPISELEKLPKEE